MVVPLLSMGGSESPQNSSKILSFVFRRLINVLQVWNDMRVSNLFLGTIPLSLIFP